MYAAEAERGPADVDAALYDGFIGDGDKARMARVRATPPAQLGSVDFGFQDPRLGELLFRYRARNWPDTLQPAERGRWDDYRRQRLHADQGLSECTFEVYFAEIARLRDKIKPVIDKHTATVGADTVAAVQAEIAKVRK